ncbi:MAG: hypothetical protein QM493_11465 [Sulfurovum sp.]
MKKILLVFLVLYIDLHSLEKKSTIKIYTEIFSNLSSKEFICLYTNDKEYIKIFKESKNIKLTSKVKNANIALITDYRTLKYVLKQSNSSDNRPPILFATEYKLLKKSSDIVGALYWRKGRSQLLFIKKRLSKHGINLPNEYQNYIIESL